MYKRSPFSIGGSKAINIPANCYDQLGWTHKTVLYLQPVNKDTLIITTKNSAAFWANLENACNLAQSGLASPRG